MGEPALETFDPYLQLKALDRRRVTFIIIGAFARVIHGTDEVTDGLDIVPSTRPENLRRLEEALRDLNAERADGQDQLLGKGDPLNPIIAFRTDGGELNVVAEPEGTRGFDDIEAPILLSEWIIQLCLGHGWAVRRRRGEAPIGSGLIG